MHYCLLPTFKRYSQSTSLLHKQLPRFLTIWFSIYPYFAYLLLIPTHQSQTTWVILSPQTTTFFLLPLFTDHPKVYSGILSCILLDLESNLKSGGSDGVGWCNLFPPIIDVLIPERSYSLKGWLVDPVVLRKGDVLIPLYSIPFHIAV